MIIRPSIKLITFVIGNFLMLSGTIVWAYSANDLDYTVDQEPVQKPTYDETPQSEIEEQEENGVCENRKHEYVWTNTSTDTSTIKYYAVMHAFAVIFDNDPNYTPEEQGNPAINDFLTNIDTETLLCMDGGTYDSKKKDYVFTYKNCGFQVDDLGDVVYEGSEWGGTRVTYQRLDFIEGSPRGFLWEYGVDSDDELDMPWVGSGNWWQVGGISFDAKDYSIDMQTATSEGWVMVEYWKENTSNNSWSQVYPIEVDSNKNGIPDNSTWDPDDDYEFWWGINAVNRSIWPACEAPEEVPVCENLTITAPTTISAEDAEGVLTITIDVDNNQGNPWDGTYEYAGYEADGDFSVCQFHSNRNALLENAGTNPFQTTNETVYARYCNATDTITVTEINYETTCYDEITIQDACVNLDIISPTEITTEDINSTVQITIQADAASKTNWQGEYTFSAYDKDSNLSSTGEFTSSSWYASMGWGSNPYTTTATTVYYHSGNPGDQIVVEEVDYTDVCRDEITAEEEEIPEPFCGDGNLDEGEACDYGAEPGEEGYNENCTEACTIEEVPEEPFCGDGNLDEGEACDYATEPGEEGYNENCTEACTIEEVPETKACLGVTISPNSTTNTQEVFTITPNPADWEGPWTWQSSNPNGIFFAENGTLVGNPITTTNMDPTDLSVEYHGAADDVITVYEATNFSSVCRATSNIVTTGGPVGDDDDDDVTGGGSSGGGPGGSLNYCGDGKIQWPNDRGVYEECDDGVLNGTEESPCSNLCQIGEAGVEELYCYEIVVEVPTESPITDLPVQFKIQAYDQNGDPWKDPDGETYHWSSSDEEGLFSDGLQSGNGLNTDKTDVSYDAPKTAGKTNDVTVYTGHGTSAACTQTFPVEIPKAPPPPPEDALRKGIETYNFSFYEVGSSTIAVNGFEDSVYGHDYDYAFYEVVYTPDPTLIVDEATLTDTIKDGLVGTDYRNGQQSGSIDLYTAISNDPTQVECWVDPYNPTNPDRDCGYGDSYRLFSVHTLSETNVVGEELPLCDAVSDDQTCYRGSIESKITFKNLNTAATEGKEIVVRYLGKVQKGSSFDCTDGNSDCAILEFTNTATVHRNTYDDLVAKADVNIICPYLLTRNAGEVYLESEPKTGFDLACYYSQYRNADGLVMTNWLNRTSNKICSEDQDEDLVGRFSSYICEMFQDVETLTKRWNQVTIEQTQQKHTTAIGRYNTTLNTLSNGGTNYTIKSFADLERMPGLKRTNTKQNVYKIAGADLIFASNTGDTIEVPKGGYTFIIENGDLYLEDNIVYASNTFYSKDEMASVEDLSDIPSIAFIVIGGDIIIDKTVETLSGIYYTQTNSEGTEGGTLTGDWADPFTPLVIYGSVYGDITPLERNRTFSGPANYDHGNIVIRYDARLFLNPPPGIEEYMDAASLRVAR